MIMGVSGLPAPDHCYDFVSDIVNDSCGSVDLTRVVGSNGSPFCDHSGCQFADSAYFYATLPTGLGKTHTIAIWA